MASDQLVDSLLTLLQTVRKSMPARHGGLTQEQFWLLHQLRQSGESTVSELATRLCITPSSVTIASKRLEKAGLVTRRRQSEDERVVRIALTERAEVQMAVWRAQRRSVLRNLVGVLDPADQVELTRLVQRLLCATQPQRGGQACGSTRQGADRQHNTNPAALQEESGACL